MLNFHSQVSHAIVDAMILTERWKGIYGEEWYANVTKDETHRVHPVSIAKVRMGSIISPRTDMMFFSV